MYPLTKIFSPVILLGFLMLTPITTLRALPEITEQQEEIQIRADYMRFDMDTGSSIYEGNVSVIQGTIELTGEKIIIKRSNKDSSEIQDIIIVGNPARYLQDDNTENRVHAVSQHMKYSEKKNQLELLRDARLEQADQIVESQRIIYDTLKKVIIAGKDSSQKTSPNERVNIILTPKKKKPDQ